MKMSDIMSAANLTFYPKVALVLFLLAFVIVVVRTWAPSSRAEMAHGATLPLEDDSDRFTTPEARL